MISFYLVSIARGLTQRSNGEKEKDEAERRLDSDADSSLRHACVARVPISFFSFLPFCPPMHSYSDIANMAQAIKPPHTLVSGLTPKLVIFPHTTTHPFHTSSLYGSVYRTLYITNTPHWSISYMRQQEPGTGHTLAALRSPS